MFCNLIKEEFADEFTEDLEDAFEPKIQIKYHTDKIDKIRIFEECDWVDLRAAEDVTLKAGEFKLISLGVSMKLPEGYEAHVVPRSSTFKTWGILQANSVGIIDNSLDFEIKVVFCI